MLKILLFIYTETEINCISTTKRQDRIDYLALDFRTFTIN